MLRQFIFLISARKSERVAPRRSLSLREGPSDGLQLDGGGGGGGGGWSEAVVSSAGWFEKNSTKREGERKREMLVQLHSADCSRVFRRMTWVASGA